MRLNALLLCRDQNSLQVLAEALEGLEIESEVSLSADECLELLAQNRYSALILDFDLPDAAQVARLARLTAPQRRPVIFGMIGATSHIAETLQAGANFVLYKPLDQDQLLRSLRAGHAFMRPDRRRTQRRTMESLVYLQFGMVALPALVLDLNEEGLALQAPESLPPISKIPFRFVLPGTSHLIEGVGELAWADDAGCAGMFFWHLTPSSRRHLKTWIEQRGARKRSAEAWPLAWILKRNKQDPNEISR